MMICKFGIGIMQGRLLPPVNGRIQCFPDKRWREEFPRAASVGLQLIEWIYELHGAEVNPLSSDRGIDELKQLSFHHGIAVRSLCADYFMDRPLLANPEEGLTKLSWLIGQCAKAGIRRIILPFVDASRIADEVSVFTIIALFGQIVSEARHAQVELHLETDLAPAPFAAFMNQLPEDVFRVNYDSGNSASHGYRVEEEFELYGTRIGSLHIKDRIRGGGTVPLGTGNTDFKALRVAMDAVGYNDDVILQVARGNIGDEVAWADQNRLYVENLLIDC